MKVSSAVFSCEHKAMNVNTGKNFNILLQISLAKSLQQPVYLVSLWSLFKMHVKKEVLRIIARVGHVTV